MKRSEVFREEFSPKLVIQTLTTKWTHATRGEPGEVKRNSLPEVMSLPDELLQEIRGNRLMHKVMFGEWHLFTPIEDIHSESSETDFEYEALKISAHDDRMKILPADQKKLNGWVFSGEQIYVSPGEWVQLKYKSSIHAEDGAQVFKKKVINIGYYYDIRPDIFKRNKPAAIHEDIIAE